MAKMTHDYLDTAGLKPAATEISKAQIAINLVDKTLWTKDSSGAVIPVGGNKATLTPTLSGPSSAYENTAVTVTIGNYLSTLTYVVTVSGGTVTRSGATITWTLPNVTADTANTLNVTAENVGISSVSSAAVHALTVLNIYSIADQASVYDSVSMGEFTSLANTTATTTLNATPINTTNIISSAVVDSFDTVTRVVDGDVVNVDGTDLVASGVSTNSIVSSTNPFGDGSLVAKYELDGNANDTLGLNNGTTSGTIAYGTMKFGNGVLNINSTNTISSPISIDATIHTLSWWMVDRSSGNGYNRSELFAKNLIYTSANYFGYSWYGCSTDMRLDFGTLDRSVLHHYVVVINNGIAELYVDGVLLSTDTYTPKVETLSGFALGSPNSAYPCNTDFDQVEIYNRALTASEVNTLYTQSAYSVPTTSVTAGATPFTAYINEHRAISNKIVQDAVDTDWNKIGTGTTPFQGKFEYTNISTATVANTLTTNTKIANGDNLVIVKLDNSVNQVVASGVTVSAGVYSMDTTATTLGEIPSIVYAVDDKLSFLDSVNGKTDIVKLSDSYVYSDLASSTNPFGDGSLIAKYELNGNALDTLGLNNGTANSVTYGAGKFGQAGVFNGSSSYITIGNIVPIKNYTISMFINIDGSKSQTFYFFEYSTNCTLKFSAGILYFGVYDSGVTLHTVSYDISSLYNTYIHVVAELDSSLNINMYINGSLVGTTTTPNVRVYGSVVEIGRNYAYSTEYVLGSIGQVEIYNRALTAAEVNVLYTQQKEKLLNTRTYTDTQLVLNTRDLEARVELKADGDKMTSLSTTLYKVI